MAMLAVREGHPWPDGPDDPVALGTPVRWLDLDGQVWLLTVDPRLTVDQVAAVADTEPPAEWGEDDDPFQMVTADSLDVSAGQQIPADWSPEPSVGDE